MSNIKPFNAEDALKSVRERIKDSFVSLIPDEQWEQMVKKEIDEFFKERQVTSSYTKQKSDFSSTVNSVLKEKATEKAKEVLEKILEDTTYTQQGKFQILTLENKIIKEFLKENKAEFFHIAVSSICHTVIQEAFYKLKNSTF
jgi:hypothetical protein